MESLVKTFVHHFWQIAGGILRTTIQWSWCCYQKSWLAVINFWIYIERNIPTHTYPYRFETAQRNGIMFSSMTSDISQIFNPTWRFKIIFSKYLIIDVRIAYNRVYVQEIQIWAFKSHVQEMQLYFLEIQLIFYFKCL